MHSENPTPSFIQSDHEQDHAFETIHHHNRSSLQVFIKQFNNYQPKSEFIDMEQLRFSQHLKLKKYKIATFYGEFLNRVRHGKGIMLYQSNRLYQGEWENDLKHGKGYQLFENGCVYIGQYVNGKPEGLGRYQWINGEFYQGQWVAGLRHGSGMWNGAKGDSYVGEWKCGKADGFGVHVWINGDRYEGQFRQNLKHGEGTEKFVSGDLYKGSFSGGKPHGFGEYYWAEGSFYKGQFVNGYRSGHGVWKRSSGNSDKYEGDYSEDKKQGYGIYTWMGGNIYKGNYFDDLRQGYGEMYWQDGSYYKGEWRKGNQEGQGMLFIPREGIKKGKFHQNTMVEIYDQMQSLSYQPVFKKKNKTVTPKKDTFRILSHPYHRKYREQAKSSKSSNIKEKISLRHRTPAKSQKIQTVTVTPTNPSTARRTRHQVNYPQQNGLFSIREHNKTHKHNQSIRMRYLDRRIHISSAHMRPSTSQRRKQINTSLK